MNARRAALAACTLLSACTPKPVPPPPPALEASRSPVRAGCPRVERAPRMWTGFSVDVPSEAMVRALDVVAPIQVALGALFCAEASLDCRPHELLAIDLANADAREARLRLTLSRSGVERELPLTLIAQGESWQAEASSLSQYFALCRAPAETSGGQQVGGVVGPKNVEGRPE